MKSSNLFRIFLLVLLVAAGSFNSCEKPEQVEEQQQQGPPSYASSDVDLQGTWDCISLVPSSDTCYLRVTFFEHYFSTDSKGQYYLQRYSWMNPQWPSGGYFQSWVRCSYLIYNGKFYMWNRELPPAQWTEMPFYANIPPTFDASLHGDTLELQCLFDRENCPNVDLPEEDHYTFVKLNR